MKKSLLVFIGLVFLIAILSCSDKSPVSLGEEWEIYAIADENDWQDVGTIIQDALQKKYVTPGVEDEYVVKHVLPKDMGKYLDRRNLLLISSMRPGSEMTKILQKALEPEVIEKIKSGDEYLFVSHDQWTRDQFLVILAAFDAKTLKASVASYPDYIYTLFNQNRNQRLRQKLFSRTQGLIEKQLKKAYGWTLKIPGYFYKKLDDPKQKLVQLNCPDPDRNIFVTWVDDAGKIELTESWMLNELNKILENYHKAYIQKGYYFTRRRRFQNSDALTIIGLWQSDAEQIGGPAQAIAFRDPGTNRIYLIVTTVFAPDRRKEPYLRELQLIVQTFKSFKK